MKSLRGAFSLTLGKLSIFCYQRALINIHKYCEKSLVILDCRYDLKFSPEGFMLRNQLSSCGKNMFYLDQRCVRGTRIGNFRSHPASAWRGRRRRRTRRPQWPRKVTLTIVMIQFAFAAIIVICGSRGVFVIYRHRHLYCTQESIAHGGKKCFRSAHEHLLSGTEDEPKAATVIWGASRRSEKPASFCAGGGAKANFYEAKRK